jgi:arylsulfatase A-like enzyme
MMRLPIRLAVLLLCCSVFGFSRAGAKPNVLFIFSDDQRADTIAALGNTHLQTPNLDRLVKRGTTFKNAFCMGSPHGAVCQPSRAMLMSGRTLFRVDLNLKGNETWTEKFGASGYSTFATGKWHNGPESLLRSFQRGKAIFMGGMGDPYNLPVQDIGTDHLLGNKRDSGEHSVKLFTDAALEFVEKQAQQSKDKPWLCYVSYNLPHDPRVAPPPWHERTNASKPPLPANFLPQHPFDNGELVVRDEQLEAWPRTEDAVRQHLADYYAAIMFVDEQVGRLLDALDRTGQTKNTVVVFSSDHGLAIGSHGLMGKQSLYEHSMKSPLLMAGPGIPEGRKCDALCYLLDIFPTLGELAGVAAPEGSEGLSLKPVMDGAVNTRRSSLITSYKNCQRAWRDEQWKVIVYPQVAKTQVFDLKSDPQEMRDLAGDAAHADKVKELTAALAAAQRESGDAQPLELNEPKPQAFDFTKVKRAKAKQE